MSYFNWDDNFRQNVAMGKVRGASTVHKFGAVPAMSQNQDGTIWDVNDTLYPWSAFDPGAANLVVAHSNGGDDGKTLTIIGLDADYNELTEEINTGTNPGTVTTTNQFIRVFRAYTGTPLVGNIEIKVGTTVVAKILENRQQTQMAVYTVPAGKTGYLYRGVCTAQASADGSGDMYIRYGGEDAFRIAHSFEVAGVGGQYDYDFSFPQRIPEKSDIDVRMTTRSNNGRYTAAFDLLLLKES